MKKILRIIDVNYNRVREGLRVIEESIRFIYEEEKLLKNLRELRHQFSKKTIEFFPSEKLKTSRIPEKDIGRKFDKTDKVSLKIIMEKNFQRIEESLRVIEEYTKMINPNFSDYYHDLRFKIYEIEKKIIAKLIRKKIPLPCLYVILNLKNEKFEFLDFAKKVVRGKPDIIQLRYKGENIKYFVEIAKELKKIIPNEIIYLINDRIDISILIDSDGVHIGQEDFEIEDARKLIPEKIIGISINSLEEGLNLKGKEVDYVAVGAIFRSPTKPERKVVGTEILKEIKKVISIPIIGIGGINIENIKDVIKNGADGIAVISFIENSENPEKTIKKLKEELNREWEKRKEIIVQEY